MADHLRSIESRSDTRPGVTSPLTPADKRVTQLLVLLSQRCHDSHQGYRKAAEQSQDDDLTYEFEQMAEERRAMATDIDNALRGLGAEPPKGGSSLGALHRLFVGAKSLLARNDRRAILEEVARGESAFEETYDEVLVMDLSYDLRRLLQAQHRSAKRARDYYASLAERTPHDMQNGVSATVNGVIAAAQKRPMLVTGIAVVAGAIFAAALAGRHYKRW